MEDLFQKILKVFAGLGLWAEGIELIGSWSFLLYQRHLGVRPFTPGALWVPSVPDFCGSENTQQKLAELMMAQECGLDVPETLCTNSLKDARGFLQGKPALFREFSMRSAWRRDRWNYFRVDFADPRSPHFAAAASTLRLARSR